MDENKAIVLLVFVGVLLGFLILGVEWWRAGLKAEVYNRVCTPKISVTTYDVFFGGLTAQCTIIKDKE